MNRFMWFMKDYGKFVMSALNILVGAGMIVLFMLLAVYTCNIPIR